MLDGIKMYKKTILRGFLQLKRPEYLIYAPFETIYHTVQGYYNFTKFHQNWMKNKKVLITDRLMEVSSVKVPLRSC